MITDLILKTTPEVAALAKEVAKMYVLLEKTQTSLNALKTPLWKDILTVAVPLVAAGVTFFVGWIVPKRSFKMAQEAEREKRKEDLQKELTIYFAKMYGELSGIADRIITALISMNTHNVLYTFHSYVLKINTDPAIKKHNDELVKLNLEKYYSEKKEVELLVEKFVNKITEFNFLRPESNLTEIYNKGTGKNFLYKYKPDYSNMNDEQASTYNEKIINDAKDYVYNNFKVQLDETIVEFTKFANFN